MKQMTAKPLSSYSSEWAPLQQTMVVSNGEVQTDRKRLEGSARTRTSESESGGDGAPMVPMKGGVFRFKVRGSEIEPIFYYPGEMERAVDVQYPFERHPQR
jgi:hypothetical protein